MERLIEYLDRMQRKERQALFLEVVGHRALRPSPAFLARVSEELGITFPDASEVHGYLDFHLDWVYVALVLAGEEEPDEGPKFRVRDGGIDATPEDVDLLLAFDEADRTHLILIEAKLDTGFTTSQIRSKAKRLRQIFGDDGCAIPGVEPHFLLSSPTRSRRLDDRLDDHDVPTWMRRGGTFAWISLPPPENAIRVTRCDENGTRSRLGGWWRRR